MLLASTLANTNTCNRSPSHLADQQALPSCRVVHRHVQPHAEHVLVVLGVDARQHQRAMRGVQGVLTLACQVCAELTRQLDLVGDGAVLYSRLK